MHDHLASFGDQCLGHIDLVPRSFGKCDSSPDTHGLDPINQRIPLVTPNFQGVLNVGGQMCFLPVILFPPFGKSA